MFNFIKKIFRKVSLGATQTLDSTAVEPTIVKTIYTPTTGSTISLSQARRQMALINPSGSLLALTINLPSSPNDNDIVVIGSSKAVTTLTISSSPASTILPFTSLVIVSFARYVYDASSTSWFRVG